MKKKIIITVIVLLIVAGAAAGGIFGYKSYQNRNLIADVVPVSSVNWGYWGDEMSSSGMVTNDLSQDIYLESGQSVSEIFVEEGQSVAIGDKLLSYDITEAELNLEMKKLELQGIVNDIDKAKKELAELKNTTPIPETPAEPEVPVEPEPDPQPQTETETPVKEKTRNAYNYITEKAKPYSKKDDGSTENPFRFLCTKEAYVYGSYLNYLRENEYTAVFEIREGNKKTGTLISSWTVNGAAMEEVEADSKWSVLDRQEIEPEPAEEPVSEEPIVEEPDIPEEPEGYTAAELAKEIKTKEQEIKDLDLDKREAELNLKTYEDACENGTVYATINGVVKTLGDPENPPQDGTAFLTVSGSEGLYVTGDISEMMLDQIKVGQQITANSWDSGRSFTATITEISKYPKSGSYFGGGNPNASYYPFTAYIEDSSGLTNGEYVDMSMTVGGDSANGQDVICIEKAYIREENGKSYVLVAGEDDRLVKRYISTGKTVSGQAVIVKEGLSMSDRIAFPYGKTAKEGVKVNDSDSLYD